MVIKTFYKIIKFYKKDDDGFYNAMDFLLIITLIPLLLISEIDILAYNFCGIYMKSDYYDDFNYVMSPHREFISVISQILYIHDQTFYTRITS